MGQASVAEVGRQMGNSSPPFQVFFGSGLKKATVFMVTPTHQQQRDTGMLG